MPNLFARSAHALGALPFATLALACTGHPLAAVDPAPVLESHQAFPVDTVKKIDLIFVVDNSGSMRQEQASLTANFPRFMDELEKEGLPDLQIAVISSDFGAGGIKQDRCAQLGDAGRFRVPAGCTLAAGAPPFLKVDGMGGKNFAGTLADTFACVATLGIDGCGYEHQLQSLRVALSEHNPELPRFLRPDAHLGIIIISDEDDCSADPDATLFTGVRPGEAPNLRCATAGHVCGGQPVTATAMNVPLSTCQPRVHATDEASRRAGLINIGTFVNHVKAMKAPGRRILVAGIFGWDADPARSYTIAADGESGGLDLQPICNVTGAGTAAPAIRLKAFVDAFGTDGSWHSICGADLRDAMTNIGKAVASVAPDTCLAQRPLDVKPETPALDVDCVVVERDRGAGSTRLVPRCTPGATSCWDVVADAACSSGARLVTQRPPATGQDTTLEVRCQGQPNK